MTSHLRLQSSFEPVAAKAVYQTSPTLPPSKKQKMSLTQTYYVASTARSKLGSEAARPDHNLRLLVGHANLLDTLMVELADAEREQEAWFNQSVQRASKPQETRHIQWIDTIAEEDEESDDADDSDLESDDGSDIYDEDAEMFDIPVRRIRSPPVEISSAEVEDFDDEDDEEHALVRVVSQHSPPELTLDSDSESEDESMPSSPEQSAFELNEKEREIITTTSFYGMKSEGGLDDGLVMQRPRQPVIATC